MDWYYHVGCPGSTPVYWRLQNSIISSENDQTKILHDEWVSPSHRVNKRSLVKSGGGLWFIPSFLKPDPNWMRESHTYTDQRLMDIRLSAENLGSKGKYNLYFLIFYGNYSEGNISREISPYPERSYVRTLKWINRNSIILCEVRFNPREVRLNIEKLRKFLIFFSFPMFSSIWGEKDSFN